MALKTFMVSLAVAGAAFVVPATAAQLTVGFSQIGSELGVAGGGNHRFQIRSHQARRQSEDRRRAAEAGEPDQGDPLLYRAEGGRDRLRAGRLLRLGRGAEGGEARPKIPVILLDRDIDPSGKDLYLTAVTSAQRA